MLRTVLLKCKAWPGPRPTLTTLSSSSDTLPAARALLVYSSSASAVPLQPIAHCLRPLHSLADRLTWQHRRAYSSESPPDAPGINPVAATSGQDVDSSRDKAGDGVDSSSAVEGGGSIAAGEQGRDDQQANAEGASTDAPEHAAASPQQGSNETGTHLQNDPLSNELDDILPHPEDYERYAAIKDNLNAWDKPLPPKGLADNFLKELLKLPRAELEAVLDITEEELSGEVPLEIRLPDEYTDNEDWKLTDADWEEMMYSSEDDMCELILGHPEMPQDVKDTIQRHVDKKKAWWAKRRAHAEATGEMLWTDPLTEISDTEEDELPPQPQDADEAVGLMDELIGPMGGKRFVNRAHEPDIQQEEDSQSRHDNLPDDDDDDLVGSQQGRRGKRGRRNQQESGGEQRRELDVELDAWNDPTQQPDDPDCKQYMLSAGPPGYPAYHPLFFDPDNNQTMWVVDLVGGKGPPSNENNALLSDVTKEEMYMRHKHDPQRWSTAALARHYRIREQRAIAIISLKRLEEQARENGEVLFDEYADYMENEIYRCIYDKGTGERNIVCLKQQPRFEYIDVPPGSNLNPGDFISEVELVEKELAEHQEKIAIEEFREALAWNLGETGQTLQRESRHLKPPKRPKAGWDMIVRPLERRSKFGYGPAFVSTPDFGKRDLTEDEQLYLKRQQPKARRRLDPKPPRS